MQSKTFVQPFWVPSKTLFKHFWCKATLLFKHFGCKATLILFFGCKARLLFNHTKSKATLLFKHFGSKQHFCSNILGAKQDFFLDVKQDFWSNILGAIAKQDFCSTIFNAKQAFCSNCFFILAMPYCASDDPGVSLVSIIWLAMPHCASDQRILYSLVHIFNLTMTCCARIDRWAARAIGQ